MVTQAAVVLGASGSVGQEIVKELIASQRFHPIILLVRQELDFGPAVTNVCVPVMTPENLEKAIVNELAKLPAQTVAVGFSALGIGAGTSRLTIEQHRSVDVDLNVAFARGLKASGKVRHLAFMSVVGADPTAKASGPGAAGFPRYHRVKGEAEQGVRGVGLAVVSIFRPALIIGSRHTGRFLERLIPLFSFMTPQRYLSITTTQIAKAMVSAARQQPQQSEVYYFPEMMKLIATV